MGSDTNIELLNYIYQNAEMGKQTIPQLLEVAEDASFRKLLESQLREYQEIWEAAASMIRSENGEAKGLNAMAKVSSYISVNFNTMIDKSSSHLAEMMMKGSNMGVIEITQKIKRYENADSGALALAHKLLKTEERNVEQLKQYLWGEADMEKEHYDIAQVSGDELTKIQQAEAEIRRETQRDIVLIAYENVEKAWVTIDDETTAWEYRFSGGGDFLIILFPEVQQFTGAHI